MAWNLGWYVYGLTGILLCQLQSYDQGDWKPSHGQCRYFSLVLARYWLCGAASGSQTTETSVNVFRVYFGLNFFFHLNQTFCNGQCQKLSAFFISLSQIKTSGLCRKSQFINAHLFQGVQYMYEQEQNCFFRNRFQTFNLNFC